MSWFTRFFRKAEPPRVSFSYTGNGQPVYWPRNYENFSKEGYRKCVIAFRCIDMIATACAGIELELYSVARGRRARREIEKHPLLDLLERPNAMQYGFSFMQAIVAFREISGNSYVLAGGNKTPKFPPTSLWPLMPNLVKIIPGGKQGLPMAYRYGTSTSYTDYPVDPFTQRGDVLHMKNFHPTDPLYGMSAMEAAADSIDQHNSAGMWNAALLQNSAMPSGALVMAMTETNPTANIPPETFERLKSQLTSQQTGPQNAGKWMILSGGLDWKQMSLSPKQMDFIETKSVSAREVCLAFGVPPMLVNIPGDNTYANYAEARQAFYEEKILPTMDCTLRDLSSFLAPRYGDNVELGYNKDDIEALQPKRDALWTRVNEATDLTVNEKRELRGYDPIPPDEGGDSILVSTSMTTLEAVEMEAQAPVPDPALLDNGEPGDPSQMDPPVDPNMAADDSSKSFKRFNPQSDRERNRIWKAHDRLKKRFEKRMASQVSALFKVEGSLVSHAVEGKGEQQAIMAASNVIAAHTKSWRPILEKNLRACGRTFGLDVLRKAQDLKSAAEFKDSQTKFDSALEFWIQHHTGELIQDLEETSKTRVIKAIRQMYIEALAEGQDGNVADFADRIEGVYDEFSKGRARLIARTEMGTASNYASMKAAKATGLQLMKQWLPRAGGANSRPDHKDMVDSPPIPMDEKFQVGDTEMDCPGDPAGGAKEVCNCECTIVFSTVDNEE